MKVHDLIAGILLFFLAALLIMNNCLCDTQSLPSYTITVVLDTNCNSDQEGANNVISGRDITLTFTYEEGWGPEGYYLDDVWHDDYELLSYQFTNVSSDHEFMVVTGMVG